MFTQKRTTAPLASPVQSRERSPFWWLRWVPAAILAILLLDLLYILGSVAIVPVLASFAIAYILNPLAYQIEKRGVSRALSAFAALSIVTLIIGGFLMFVIPDLWNQSVTAGQKVMTYMTPENARRQRAALRRYSPLLDRLTGERVEQFISDPASVIGSPATWFAGGLSDFLTTASTLLDLFIIPFFVYYILVDFSSWRDSLEDLIPQRFRDPFSRLFDEVGRILESYVRGQLLIAMLMGAMYAVGFVALGVPAWAGIATLAGFLNMIPYVGTISGMILATGFTLADGGGFWRISGVLGVFAAVQSIEGYYLTPRILGGRLSLHPMAVFLGLLIGGKLYGFLGIILAVPTIAVAKVFLKFFRELYKASHFYHAGDVAPHEAPSPILEERIAEAADTVLADQVNAETGDELLAPDVKEDDPIARATGKPDKEKPERLPEKS
ncbi:MAG TPA: AI-2E family transporter [Blastocatellia bacterium]|nr:AI-2E family transporter [Blastocatellia bacterium]